MATLMALPTTVSVFQQRQLKVDARASHYHFGASITHAQLSTKSNSTMPIFIPHIHETLQSRISQSKQFITMFMKDTKNAVVQVVTESLFSFLEESNPTFEGNFAPVDEIGLRVPVKVIEGAIPDDFPIGVFIRNGPNPQFGGKSRISPLFGKLFFHWFEGDGMLHATYFGSNGQVSYKNKYVETEEYMEEKKKGKQLWINTLEGDSKALRLAYFLNQLQFGKVNKTTCNTSLFKHAGRLFANSEAANPYEIDPATLSTLGEWDIGKQWGRPFTSHPKVVQETNEMVIFGFQPIKPYYMTGLISADGKQITHKCDAGLENPSFSHELAITKNYDIIMDFPFTINVQRLFSGGDLVKFDDDYQARIGIKPRRGDTSSIQWFPVDSNFTFHMVNSYEEGEEVVLHGCQSRRPIMAYKMGIDKREWFERAIKKTSIDNAKDPDIDGVLFSKIHEWRFNLRSGLVKEKDLINHASSMDMPKINEKYIGIKNRFAYASIVDHEASTKAGMPKYGQLVKIDFCMQDEGCNLELYHSGHGIFFSESLFVARPGGSLEDDGWVVTYAHDENTDTCEVHIIDAQRFSHPPIAKIKLPQRVPYGFHSIFLQGSF